MTSMAQGQWTSPTTVACDGRPRTRSIVTDLVLLSFLENRELCVLLFLVLISVWCGIDDTEGHCRTL